MGREFIGIVEDAGSAVRTVKKGDLVVTPFAWSDGTCEPRSTGSRARESASSGRGGALQIGGGEACVT